MNCASCRRSIDVFGSISHRAIVRATPVGEHPAHAFTHQPATTVITNLSAIVQRNEDGHGNFGPNVRRWQKNPGSERDFTSMKNAATPHHVKNRVCVGSGRYPLQPGLHLPGCRPRRGRQQKVRGQKASRRVIDIVQKKRFTVRPVSGLVRIDINDLKSTVHCYP